MKYKLKMSGTFEHEMEIEGPHEDYVRQFGAAQIGKIELGKLDKVETNASKVVAIVEGEKE